MDEKVEVEAIELDMSTFKEQVEAPLKQFRDMWKKEDLNSFAMKLLSDGDKDREDILTKLVDNTWECAFLAGLMCLLTGKIGKKVDPVTRKPSFVQPGAGAA